MVKLNVVQHDWHTLRFSLGIFSAVATRLLEGSRSSARDGIGREES